VTRRRRPPRVPRGQEEHLAGVRALADGVCARCPEPILKDQRIVPARDGGWMHTSCASGADDA
jgi:hypothetical protein